MWVKICANTNAEDALLAAELGADAVGFVFAPSVRQVTAADVAHITPLLPGDVERVGVFPAWGAEQIAATVREAGLTTVQLHGGFDLELVRRLQDALQGGVRIIQTVHWEIDAMGSSEKDVAEQLREIAVEPALARVLVDSKIGAAAGGTGVTFDWKAARAVLVSSGPQIILAGGLRPGNVDEAIRELRPWGVDVASGVEASPGRKDPEKLAQFIEGAKRADWNRAEYRPRR